MTTPQKETANAEGKPIYADIGQLKAGTDEMANWYAMIVKEVFIAWGVPELTETQSPLIKETFSGAVHAEKGSAKGPSSP